jgi:phosphopantetheinyl transferase
MPEAEVRLACARPPQLGAADCADLAAFLDAGEIEASRRLRFEADRRSFVVARAMLRALVAHTCGLDPHEIALRHDARGRPYVAQAPDLHVSLSRSREAVACAVTRTAPVGVDIEPIAARPVDAGLLGEFLVAAKPIGTRQFYLHWTALEAFWKACGTGLADGQPRICCVPRSATRFDVHLEHGSRSCAGRGAVVHAYDDCALTVVLRAPVDPGFVVKRTDCGCAADIHQLCRATAAAESFFAT